MLASGEPLGLRDQGNLRLLRAQLESYRPPSRVQIFRELPAISTCGGRAKANTCRIRLDPIERDEPFWIGH